MAHFELMKSTILFFQKSAKLFKTTFYRRWNGEEGGKDADKSLPHDYGRKVCGKHLDATEECHTGSQIRLFIIYFFID